MLINMNDRESRVGNISKLEFVDDTPVMLNRPVMADDLTGSGLALIMSAGINNINQLQGISNNYQV